MAAGSREPKFDTDASLTRTLVSDFTADESRTWEEAKAFKERFAIPDDRLRRVLTDIRRNTIEKRALAALGSREGIDSRRMLIGVMVWLPLCPDAMTKPLLLDTAANPGEDGVLRTVALLSYLRIADAGEAKEALIRFLVGKDRMESQARSSILENAYMAYQEADLDKKRAILETLYASLAKEDAKWLFRVYDNILSQMSQQYLNSEERRGILKRLIHATPTCKADEYAMPELEGRLRELQKTKPVAAISTNLAALDARDFSRPPSEGDAVAAAEAPSVAPAVAAATPLKGLWRYVLGGAAVLILAAAGVWVISRRRKASRP